MSPIPAVFFGHGSPMNAIEDNQYTQAWTNLGEIHPKPRAILAISAHWFIRETAVTAMEWPRTLHDFRGFPSELYEIDYHAPGDPTLAASIAQMLKPLDVRLDKEWDLDHGAWSVLRHLYPLMDVPVVQLSIDRTKPPTFHYEVGQRLQPLRKMGIFIMGSGNIVHNLNLFIARSGNLESLGWAERFDGLVRETIIDGREEALIHFDSLGADANLAIPTPDHFLPLLYILGARSEGDEVFFSVDRYDGGAISMRAVQFGGNMRSSQDR
ncbi:4,5-DOPA dioxygenase extradiol [Candidatus Neomarinimicrobiota bacterium]